MGWIGSLECNCNVVVIGPPKKPWIGVCGMLVGVCED